ncbi:MAG: ATP-dependent DNA helicase RecG [Ruminococcaceae bacterium]|nr:ATP-dependent DNA helicase RecG [Oscillospiraceae bacterium]
MAELDKEVRYLSGVGEKRAKLLGKLKIFSFRDVLMHFPRAYEDRTVFKAIGEVTLGESVCVRVTVASEPVYSYVRKGMELLKFRVTDGADIMNVTFFNRGYLRNEIHRGDDLVLYGKIGGNERRPEMINPIMEREASEGGATGKLVPIYRMTAGINSRYIEKLVFSVLERCGDELPDPLPSGIRKKYQLCSAGYAYENIHFPKDYESLDTARRRLIFEELFVIACAMKLMRGTRITKAARVPKPADLNEYYRAMPFELTGAQKRAINEAVSDMTSGRPMSRLVQGDVGSGKTVVSAACCWLVVKSGYQAAVMAPTEILANQHYQTFSTLLGGLGIRVGILTGAMTAKKRRETLEAIKTGEIDVIVGTHALISESVEYKTLALVITDEQHRFGVQQRAALSAKGESPHVLVMSATPIPRTLALIIYGELDVSVIDELPAGRQKVDTFAVGENYRTRVYNFVRKIVGAGNQVYIVCPMVEEGEDLPPELKSVEEYGKQLKEEIFPDISVGIVHGKMKPKDKERVMSAFGAGETKILVSTTVIEVGVDVPNAVLMIVENADRFGLSQLHQLRGRVGRGKDKSYCILFKGAGGDISAQRLKILCSTNDGFEIAEEDLQLRGPGDFFGSRQHGLPETKISEYTRDIDLVKLAQQAALDTLADDPKLDKPENQKLYEEIERVLAKSADTFS